MKPQHEPQVKNGEQKSHPLLLFSDLLFSLFVLSSEQALSSQQNTELFSVLFKSFIEFDEQQGLIDKPNTITAMNIEKNFTNAKLVIFIVIHNNLVKNALKFEPT